MAWQGLSYLITLQSYQMDSKVQGVDWRSCHVWTRSCSYWSQVNISLNYQDMEVVFVAMSSHFHPQQLLFTKKLCWYKKVVQNSQSSSKHFLDLGARVLNFKEVYLAHLLVFLSDYKNILLQKGLLTITSKVSRIFHVEEIWWWRKITSPPDEPLTSHVWLQMIIT